MLKIYHNPRCSKSREALAIVEEHARASGASLQVIEYLETPPSRVQLQELQAMLECPVSEMVRNGEDEYVTLGLAQADEEALLDALASHPKLLQRPIVVNGKKAIIGRPPEKLRSLLD